MVRSKKNARLKKRARQSFSRAWAETEIDDDGELVLDMRPVPCPTCQHPIDLGGLDDIDVHRCGFCQKRARFLWSGRRGGVVPDTRGAEWDWTEETWDELWRDFEMYGDDEEEYEFRCANGCQDPVFGGPAGEVCDGDRWVCSVCGSDGSEDEEAADA